MLPMASVLSPLTNLTDLDVSYSRPGQDMQPRLAELDWPPDLFRQLCHLKQLTCA